MIISDMAIRNRTTVMVLVLIIILMGLSSYLALPREAQPDVPIPIVLVSVSYEGVSPEDIESSVTLKLEKELTGLKGLKELRSQSAEGMSMIIIEFMPDVVIDDALQYVRARIDRAKGELPQDAKEPVIQEINIAEFPVIYVNISGDPSAVRMKQIAKDLEDAIEAVPGVLNVQVQGALEREIRLEIDPDRVAAYDLTIPDILKLIPSENVNISAGGLETDGTKFNVRVPAEFVEPEEVDHLLLTVRDGKPIYLTDVARVRDTFKDRAGYSRLNGREAVTLSIQKRVGENAVSLSERVRVIVDAAQQIAPNGVKFEITYDMAKYVRDMVADLENNIAAALILVMLVLVLFMTWQSSLIVALIIPLSMLMSFVVLEAMGYTLNMIVLFSLVLGLGMLVDNAIVIVENIYRHMQIGYPKIEAAVLGTREVAWPVTTSTLTTVAAFLPMIFWPGIMGDFMKYLPITLTITLMSSLLVALIVNPTVTGMFAHQDPPKRDHKHWFLDGYRRLLTTALTHRGATLALSVCMLVLMSFLYGTFGKGVEFFPDIDPDRVMVDVRFPQGTNVRETDRLVREIERRIEPYRKDLKHVITTVGSSASQDFGGGGDSGPHTATVTMVFPDYELRARSSREVMAAVRRDLADLAGAEIKVAKEREGPPTGAPVTVRIVGRDLRVLEELSRKATAVIVSTPGLVNLRSDLEATRPEIVFHVDRRRATLLGVSTATVGNYIKTAVFGNKVGTYREYNEEYDITVRLPLEQRVRIEDLYRLRVPNAQGKSVPLSSLGEFDYKGGFGTINRVNQKRVVTLTGDAEGRLGPEVLADAQKELAKLGLPPGYEIRYAGEKEEEDKARAFLSKAFVIACLLITLILVAQFNSLIVPAVIMSTVVLSVIGGLLGLLVCGLPFGIIMSGIGFISLAGVVVNNAIVLLDYTRQLQGKGMDVVAASIEAGQTRLRPVLLTAGTTVIGLLPMAVGVSYDFHAMEWATKSMSTEWWRNMSVIVIFGLGVATLLTLIVVPTLYIILFNATARWLKGEEKGLEAGKERGATP
jgi:multidrug efflux pump subunit AcrB